MPCTQMGRVMAFLPINEFCVLLPSTKARLPCPLVMADVMRHGRKMKIKLKFWFFRNYWWLLTLVFVASVLE